MEASRKLRTSIPAFILFILFTFLLPSQGAENVYFTLQIAGVHGPQKKIPVHLDGQCFDYLDFRVYRVKDPAAFFKELKDPHSFGTYKDRFQREGRAAKITIIEKIRDFRQDFLGKVKDYLRQRLSKPTRRWVRQVILGKAEARKEVQTLPLVPYLNKDLLVKSWRESYPKGKQAWQYHNIYFTVPEQGVYVLEVLYQEERAYAVALVSNLVLMVKEGQKGQVVYCLDRNNGEPQGQVNLSFYQKGQLLKSSQSGKDGYAPLTGVEGKGGYLFAQKDKDFAFIDLRDRSYVPYTYAAYIYTERPVYRPGQKVFYKAIARKDQSGQYRIELPASSRVEVKDSKNNTVHKAEKKWNSFGSLSGEFTLPQETPLGDYRVMVGLENRNYDGQFRVEEYKKPEFEVKITLDQKHYVLGDTIKAKVAAKYYFGSPVVEATVRYNVFHQRYYPPWWREEGDYMPEDEEEGYYGWGRRMVSEQTGTLDANGELTITVNTDKDIKQDSQYIIEARVTDKSRREITGIARTVATRGEFILFLDTDRYVYKPGEKAKVKVRAQDLEGNPVKTQITFTLRKEKRSRGQYREEAERETLEKKTAPTNPQGIAYAEFQVPKEGYLFVEAEAQDARGNKITESRYLWVGAWSADWGWERGMDIIPDKKAYKPGETAKILISAPPGSSFLVLTVEREGVFFRDMVKINGPMLLYDLPIKNDYIPNVFINAHVFKDGSFVSASKILMVPPKEKFLKVTILPQKAVYKPSEEGEVTLLVQDAKGAPVVNTELSLGVVDESIYAIVPELAPDIQKFFYGKRWNQTNTRISNNFYFRGYSGKDKITLAEKRSESSPALAAIKGETYQEPRVRRLFQDTALWRGHVVTDGRGQARVKVPFPDNLTTWRATARAVTLDTKVGAGTAKTITRKDLILRLEVPRFMRDRDQLVVSSLVHNYLAQEKRTKVTLEAQGVEVIGPKEQVLTLGKNAEVRVDWKIKVTKPGPAVFLAKALTDQESDAMELTVPVLPHGVEQRIALAGDLSASVPQEKKSESFTLPQEMLAGTQELKIVLSPSLASTVLPALDYLAGYPYGCVEQTMSRFFPTLVTAKAMNQLGFEYKKSKEIPKMVKQGLERLYSQQNSNGGWGWWQYDEGNLEMTAYVLEGLYTCRQLGYEVDRGVISKGRQALAEMIKKEKTREHWAYGLYVLQKTGGLGALGSKALRPAPKTAPQAPAKARPQPSPPAEGLDKELKAALEGLYQNHPSLSDKDTAYLAMTYGELGDKEKTKILLQSLQNKAQKVNGFVHWGAKSKDPWQDEQLPATAVALQAYLYLEPQNANVPKAARWLALNRRDGHWWESTKTTARVILALVDYLKVSQELWPDYNLKVEVNGRLVNQTHITRKDVNNSEGLTFSLKDLKVGKNEVTIHREGPGVLYYSLLTKYFTAEENIAAKDYKGLKVSREYFLLNPVGGEKRITYVKDRLPSEVKSGSDIFVRVTLESDQILRYFMIEDFIPAGCEIIEKVERFRIRDENYYEDFGWHWWYSGREARDNRMAFFATHLPRGKSTFTYILKAQIPGEYHVMPTEGSLMYFPTVRAVGKEYRMKIVD